MTVSMRSTKAQMYSEIERLRTYCDQLEQQLRAKPKAAPKRRRHSNPGGTDYAGLAPDACKHFGVKIVTKQQIYDYINECLV